MQKARYSSYRRGLPGRQEVQLSSFLLSLGTDAFLQLLVLFSLDSESFLGHLCTALKAGAMQVFASELGWCLHTGLVACWELLALRDGVMEKSQQPQQVTVKLGLTQ